MELDKIVHDLRALPLDLQREAADFIEFLHARKPAKKAGKLKKESNLLSEPFIGMWKDMTAMKDSSEWVKNLRQVEWQ